MADKKKYYVVWQGVNPGVYDSWDKCQQQIKGYPQAKYKSFGSREEAEAAYGGNFAQHIQFKSPTRPGAGSPKSAIRNPQSIGTASAWMRLAAATRA